MLDKLLKPFTTASAGGVVLRDLVIAIGAILAILGALGVLTPEQVEAIQQQLNTLFDPKVLAALGTLMLTGMSLYRSLTKSSSDKAAGVAKTVDADVPATAPVVIQTPAGQPDIVIDQDGRKVLK